MKQMFKKLLSYLDPCYKDLHWGFLKDKRFSHVWLLLIWVLIGIGFWGVEYLDKLGLRDAYMTTIYSPQDDLIPFCEWFLFPYLFWFAFLIGMYVYTLLFEVDVFRKMMYYTAITYLGTVIIYFIFPNQQLLRPDPSTLGRDNALIQYMIGYWEMDTYTNVFPSLHVIGSFCASTAAWNSKRFGTAPWRIAFTSMAILISMSTVFLKQHSVLDVYGGLILCAIAYIPIYYVPNRKLSKLKRARKTPTVT